MIKTTKLSLLLATLLGLSVSAFAQTPGIDLKGSVGYAIDGRANVVKSGSGLCWRTGYWTPAMAIEECDPDLVKKEMPKPMGKPMDKPVGKPVAPMPKPAAQKVTLAADALFDFNKADLRSEGKAKLDALAGDIKKIKLEVIIAVGHADRFGSDAYNQKLSEKRAEAVKAHLVSKGIEPNRIYTEGKGEKQPITKADQCKGGKSKKTVDCLQPDRRVEIEVIGTKM